MIGKLLVDDKGVITNSVSAYLPPKEVRDLTYRIQQDYQVADNLQNRPFTEFNDESLLARTDLDQKRWNAYREPMSEDIDEAWRWNGIRPITRNRILGIVAQMTANLIIPAPFAQNDQDEVDMAAAQVMRDLMEYDIRNSTYVDNYIMWVTSACVDPAAYMGVGFFDVMQTIKEENEGKISKKEVLDGVSSGFQTFNIPVDEVLISNFYTKQLDKQRFIIRRRYVDYDEAEGNWGEHNNFQYVRPGVANFYDDSDSLFYETYDQNLETLAEEVVYINRREDVEIPFVNGIYMGDSNVEANLIKHRDNENRPKYNFSVLGYEDISPRFFYYMSAARKLGDDDALVIRMEQLTVDATFLSGMPPTVTSGIGQMNEAVMIPGKNTVLENADAKIQPIQLGSAIQAGWNAVLHAEKSMSESTQDPMATGIQSGPQKTKYETALLAENAKIALGRFGNMITSSLRKVGGLMIDVILQHQTVGDIEETSDGQTVQKFKSFILTPQGDQKMTKKIRFNPDLMGQEMSEEDMMMKSEDMIQEEGGVDSDMRIAEANPEEWRKLKFHLVIDVKELLSPALIEMSNQARQQEMLAMQQQPNQQKVGVATQ